MYFKTQPGTELKIEIFHFKVEAFKKYIQYIYMYIPWSKSSQNSFRKFKIQVLFIKSDIVAFKVLPINCNALMPALDPALETFLEIIVGIAIRTVFDFSITSFRLLKRVPDNDFSCYS